MILKTRTCIILAGIILIALFLNKKIIEGHGGGGRGHGGWGGWGQRTRGYGGYGGYGGYSYEVNPLILDTSPDFIYEYYPEYYYMRPRPYFL